MLDIIIDNSNNNFLLLDLNIDNKKKSKPNINKNINFALFNKIIKNIKDFFNIYIKNKYIKIIKYKPKTLAI